MIHVFGDSFSEDYKLTRKDDISYIWRYVDYLGRDIKLYCDLLSEHLNQPITNYSIGGICNEHIFILFMENFSKIKPNDIVIFGWTEAINIFGEVIYSQIYFYRSILSMKCW